MNLTCHKCRKPIIGKHRIFDKCTPAVRVHEACYQEWKREDPQEFEGQEEAKIKEGA